MKSTYTNVRMSKIERIPKDLGYLECSYLSYGSVNWYNILESCLPHPLKLIAYIPSVSHSVVSYSLRPHGL